MQIPVDIYFKIKRLKSSRSTGCKFVWYSDRNGRGCGRIETSSCIWSNVWWNTTLDRAGILQKWNEFLCSSNRKPNDKHYKTLRHISFFLSFFFLEEKSWKSAFRRSHHELEAQILPASNTTSGTQSKDNNSQHNLGREQERAVSKRSISAGFCMTVKLCLTEPGGRNTSVGLTTPRKNIRLSLGAAHFNFKAASVS